VVAASRGLGRHTIRPPRARSAIVLAAVLGLAASAGPAAADPVRNPSGEVLREAYPLKTKPLEGDAREAAPARRAGQRSPVEAAEKGGSDLTLGIVLVLVVALGVTTLWPVRARLRGDAPARTAPPPPPRPETEPEPKLERSPPALVRSQSTQPRGRRFEPARRSLRARPPDAGRDWTAEITWRSAHGQSRFALVGRPEEGSDAVILASDPIEWPPRGDDEVASLERLVSGLEVALLGAGWTALDPGEAWYAKRFHWAARTTAAAGGEGAGPAESHRALSG
jgi:hypothetical protein